MTIAAAIIAELAALVALAALAMLAALITALISSGTRLRLNYS